MENQSGMPQELRDIWTDAYKFHAHFAHMGNSSDEWENCAAVMGQLILKHKSHPFAGEIFLMVYTWLGNERRQLAYDEAMARATKAAVASG